MRLSRPILALALLVAFASTACAYSYYVSYASRTAPFNGLVEKFDLNVLNNKTVNVLISDQGPNIYSPGDSYTAVVSQIRSAAKVWNDVASSDLRLAYAGLVTAGTPSSSPYIEVDFSDDVPPGLVAYTAQEVRSGQTANGFTPIQRSRIVLKRDLAGSVGPSYSEFFFTTLVHEFGHALGLQHTLTSSVMATSLTNAATKAAPLAPDDLAGISLLYPAAGYSTTVGSIRGRVAFQNGTGVNLASVSAISTSNDPISTLTNPDGTFQIDGLPPQQYYLYVQPLPLAQFGETYPAGINPPVDAKNAIFGANTNFVTQFYPGTRDFNQAQFLFVYPATVTSGANFTVSTRSGDPISPVQLFGYTSTNVAVTSPQLFAGVPVTLVGYGSTGLLQSPTSLAPGLNVGLLGTSATIYNVRPYYQQYVALDVLATNTAGTGPKHLVFSTPTDLYVRPSAFTVVTSQPPALTSIIPGSDSNGNRILTISGTNLQPDTRYYFDGLPGTVQGTTADGKILVTPPSGPAGYTAAVVALNASDPQSSLFLQAPTPYTYDGSPAPSLTVTPQFLTPAVDTVVDIVANGANFTDGQVIVGFGSADIQVKKVTVISPIHLTVVVTAPSGPAIATSSINVTSGLKIFAASQGTLVGPPAAQ